MNLELEVFVDTLTRLESLKCQYIITGSIAKVYYSTPRMTRDMDIVIQVANSEIPKFVATFKDAYDVDDQMIEQAIRLKQSFNIIHQKNIVKVDFIIKQDRPFENAKFDRRKRVEFFGIQVWIISKEDLILSKLDWARESLSALQFRDVEELLLDKGLLDMPYIEAWLEKLKLQDLFFKLKKS